MKDILFSKDHIKIFQKIGILAIYLFGSQVKGATHLLSDVDIGVAFEHPEKYEGKTLDVYSALYDIFVDVLPKEYLRKRFELREHEFDIVFLQFAPLGLQFNATRDCKVLYEKSEKERFGYQEEVIKRYLDMKYFYDLSYKCLLERI